VSDGISESTGINLQSLISGFLGGKMAAPKEVDVSVQNQEASPMA
jgi:flotillin